MPHSLVNELHFDLRQQLSFETLLSNISATFINLPIDQIDENIEDAQRQVCECLGFDFSTLWQWSMENSPVMTLTHFYSPPEGLSRPAQVNGEQDFPWTYGKMMEGETVSILTERMPDSASREKETRRHYGIKSAVVIPLKTGGKPIIGLLSFADLHKEQLRSNQCIKRLELVSQIFGNALTRKLSDKHLRESETRLSLAADSANAGIWEYDCRTQLFWATEQARAIFGFNSNEEITMERFERSVYPDDLPGVRQAIIDAVEQGTPVDVEYRIRVLLIV